MGHRGPRWAGRRSPLQDQAGSPPSPLRILFVVDGLWVGGTERSLVEMLPGLRKAGFQLAVACLERRQEGVEQEALAAGATLHFLDSGGLWSQVRSLRRLLGRQQPHILHTALYRSNLVGRLAAIGHQLVLLNSLVNTPYEPIRFEDPNLSAPRLRAVQAVDALGGRLLTDHFHAVSQAVKQAAIHRLKLPAARITVVERGRDRKRLGEPSAERRTKARRELGLGSEAEVLVTVGRQDYQKGLRHLLDAVARLSLKRPALCLLITGRRGRASNDLEELTHHLGLAGRVRFLGHRRDVPEILAAADVFVFPSLFEGFPGAIVEAMALGLPIVASDIPPVREAVEAGRNAKLVKPRDSSELASAIDSLLLDGAVASAYGRHSRELYMGRFTLDATLPKMVALYRRLGS